MAQSCWKLLSPSYPSYYTIHIQHLLEVLMHVLRCHGRAIARHRHIPSCLLSNLALLKRLDHVIDTNSAKVDSLVAQFASDMKKVRSKFDILDQELFGDVTLTRKKLKNGESLKIKFNCESEVSDFDDDDGYDRIIQSLERAEEMDLDYSDKIALGEQQDGVYIDVHITKGLQRLTFNCIASNKIVIQKVYFDSPLSQAGDKKELKCLYKGPKYVDLEENIRDELQNYLKTRLVDDFLSSFIFNYARIKREKELIQWAIQMKTFTNNSI